MQENLENNNCKTSSCFYQNNRCETEILEDQREVQRGQFPTFPRLDYKRHSKTSYSLHIFVHTYLLSRVEMGS